MNPNIDQTIPEALDETAAQWPDRVALQMVRSHAIDRLTYGEFIDRSIRAAEKLKAAGLCPGDRIILLAENSPEWLIACLAALRTGCTLVPLDTALTPSDIETLIHRADPRGLMLSAAQLKNLSARLPAHLPVFQIETDLDPAADHPARPAPDASPTPDPDADAALLLFTSGTTAMPKGILLGHAGLIQTAQGCILAVEQPESEAARILCVLPLHHVTGFTVTFLGAMLRGSTVSFVETLNAQSILSAMQKTRTSILPGVPRLFELFHREIHRKVAAKGALARGIFHLLSGFCAATRRITGKNIGRFAFRSIHQAFGGSLRLCCSGAAPLPLEVLHGLERLGFTFIEAYGLTETSGVASTNAVSARRAGTVGPPIPGVQIRIANPRPSTGEGEICIRGTLLMRGYFRDPEATSEAVREGWLHTGDLGKLDQRGYLTVTGRLKEVIVTPGGKNVSPVDVENRYRNLPGVQDLAVFGMPAGEGYGEEIHAAAILEQAASPKTVEAAIQARAPEIPSYMRIQNLHIVSEIPRTTTLKVKRRELEQRISGAKETGKTVARAAVAEADDLTRRVIDIVGESMRHTAGASRIAPEATLQFDLGIDSLGLLELAARIQRTLGVRLDERRLPALYTVADLIAAVQSAPESAADDGRTEPVLPPRGLSDRALLRTFGIFSRILWKCEIIGREHIPQKGPYILCPNHESHIDIFLVASCLRPAQRRTLCCFAKREHFERLGTRLVARLACAIPTDRDGDIMPALRAGQRALGDGRLLLIHPEGTRTRTGDLGPFRGGAARLSLSTGAPLIPVRISGAYDIFPAHRRLPRLFNWLTLRRHTIRIAFGPPVFPEENIPVEDLTQRLRQAVVDLNTTSA